MPETLPVDMAGLLAANDSLQLPSFGSSGGGFDLGKMFGSLINPLSSLPSLGLSLADATTQTANSGAPVVFGAMAFGRGTAGATSVGASPSLSGSSTPVAVTPVTSLPGAGAGGQSIDPFALLNTWISGEMGLNGGQVQDPRVTQALYGRLPNGVTATAAGVSDEPGFGPGPIAIAGIGIALVAAAFVFLR